MASCCGTVDIDAAVVCAFMRDMPTGVPVQQIGIDAIGACVLSPIVSSRPVVTSTMSATVNVGVGPFVPNAVAATSPTITTIITNLNADKSLELGLIPVNYGSWHLQNIGSAVASGVWQMAYEMFIGFGVVPNIFVSGPNVGGIGRVDAAVQGVAVRSGYTEVRGEDASLVFTLAPLALLDLRHRVRCINNGAIDTSFSADFPHNLRGYVHIIAVPRS